ncbi:head-to-tail stopper [Gordonia phage Malibo]|nr:head-to-tail stopper [Gordonia phage Malibo]
MLGTETVTVTGDFVRDDDGKVTAGTGVGPVEGCQVQPLTSQELVERGRSATDDAVRVLLPITEGIDRGSVLVVRGKRYQVDGNPIAYIDPEDPELSGYDVEASRRVG